MILLGFVLASTAPHVNSFSLSEVHVRRGAIELHHRCQVLSLGEVIETLDPELDGVADEGEVAAHADAIAAYVADHYRLYAGGLDDAGQPHQPGAQLVLSTSSVAEAELALDPMNEVSEWVDVRLVFEGLERPPERLGIVVDPFEVTSPGHRDSTAVVWNGIELGARQFSQGAESTNFAASSDVLARNEATGMRFLRRGAASGARTWDALLLVLLFVLGARASRASALLSGGVAVAAILAGATLVRSLDLSPAQVRFLPISLAFALVDLALRAGRTRVLEALVFGAVIGARAVVSIAPELQTEAEAEQSLAAAAFGLGTALAPAAAVLLTVLLLAGGARSRDPHADANAATETALGPRGARRALDAAALCLAGWSCYELFLG